MLSYSENILQTLTGKSSLNEVSEDELERIADQYPYFSAAQFLLAKKLYPFKKEYKTALQKAALHFADVLWLDYNLLEEESTITINETLTTAENFSAIEDTTAEELNRVTSQNEDVITSTEENQPPELQTSGFEILDEPVAETENAEVADETEQETNEKLSNLLKEQAAAFEKPVEENVLPVETTAYHRIDYFDSQGIKLDPEKESNDKLGAQLKRFTDWLKQMKRINPNNLETDADGELQVQHMAEHSNEPKEIVTESMAEVLIKQGKPEQAIRIYEKLSFFNPSKSAYFAAKIQELKA